MQFASDNWAGATPEVMAALARANGGYAPAYGNDELTARVTRRFAELFEHDVEVWFTATGTASNSLGLASLTRPGGLVLCSAEAHIHTEEWGATELFSGGLRLVPMPHADGRVGAEALDETLARFPEGNRFGIPAVLSLTNATELGTVYSPAAVAALAARARARNMAVHMDGARFANAVAALGCTPAELTWQAGVDLMSFGGTKNGCWAAEAIVVFAPEKLDAPGIRRQRAGHTFSKSRFVAAQFEAYLADGNWLKTAGQANGMAARLAQGIATSGVARLGWQPDTNEVFALLPKAAIPRLREAGAVFYEWPHEALGPNRAAAADEQLVRMVTSWATREADVDQLLGLL